MVKSLIFRKHLAKKDLGETMHFVLVLYLYLIVKNQNYGLL